TTWVAIVTGDYDLSLRNALPISGPDAAPIDWQRHLGRWCEGADEQDAVAARIADIERAIAFLLDVRAPRPGRGGDEVEHELDDRSEEHTSELQSREKLVCRLLLE